MSTVTFLQIEITTRCNFDCFYCAGRLMRQGDMPEEAFNAILQRHIEQYGIPEVVSLQGEGEPTLHKAFFDMAAKVRSLGAQPYTITNGSYRHPEHFIGAFTKLGISVDTLDESVATTIGRYNLARVQAFAAELSQHLRVVIHSVAHPEHTPSVAAWCQENGYAHVVQPLQTKPDYSHRYPQSLAIPPSTGRFSCEYLARPKMRYYNLEGMEMPCCFIKDTDTFDGLSAMLRQQEAGTWPRSCTGCRYANDTAPAH
jgi:MoaA/NifB/PqqE/SkfB family radical SAM enzyme